MVKQKIICNSFCLRNLIILVKGFYKYLFFFSIIFILFSVNVNAQVIATSYATGATSCLQADNAQWLAQSFQVAADYTMTKAVVEINNNLGTTDIVTVELRADNAGSPGSILASTTISTTYNTCDLSAPWVDATLSYCLQAGVTYYIVMHNTEAAANGYGWIGNTAGGYASGQQYRSTDQGASWLTDAATDLFFEVWGTVGCGPDAPILYNTGGTDQLAFNNAYIFDASPIFRASATHSEAFDGFQLEINTSSAFDGTSYTQEFLSVDAYSSGTQYNVECNSLSPAFIPSNGTTYYVRACASSNNGSTWGDWSSDTYSFSYKSSGDTDWYQTTEEQFDTDDLSSTDANATDDVRLGAGSGSANDYDYSTGAETDKWCYYTIMANNASFVTSSFIQAPSTETDIGTANYPTIATNNDAYINLDDKVPFVFHYKYTISEAEVDVTQITVFERLYSESATSHTLYIWNSTASTWESLATSSLAGLHDLGGDITTNLTDYIDGSSQVNVCIYRADPGNQLRQFGPDYPKIAVTSSAAASSGTITSTVIDYASFLDPASWSEVLWTDNETNGDLKYKVYYDNSGTPTIIPDGALATNSTGFDTSPVDISGLVTGTYNKLYLFATLTDAGGTPILQDWTVTCNYSVCTAPTIDAKADAADSKTICTGSSVALTGGDGGDGSDCGGSWEYGWYTGDGTGSTWYDGTDWNNAEAYNTGWEDPTSVSPISTTTYTVNVRCNFETTCNNSDAVTVTVDQNPTIADAGSTQTICAIVTMDGNDPVIGSGTWTRISGPNTPNIVNANLYNTQIGTTTTMIAGTYVYRWTISNGTCTDSWDEVTINADPPPTTSDAGSTQNLCLTSATLDGNNPTVGTGTWTRISGPNTPNIVNASLYNTQIGTTTAMIVGTYVYRWTISNGGCPDSWDEVTINIDAEPTTANAGSLQTICAIVTMDGNDPVIGTGTWTRISGPNTPNIVNANLYNTQIGTTTAMIEGTYVYRWTISNGGCTDSWDEVTIEADPAPTTSDAGSAQNLCLTTTTTLDGNNPTVGTGVWTRISGPNTPNIVNASLYNTQIGTTTAMVVGTYVYRWTISNGGCPDSWDEVSISIVPTFTPGAITGGGGIVAFEGDPGVMTANPSGGSGTYNYQWYYIEATDCPDIGGATLIGGATNQTYDPPSGIAVTTSYQCQVDATGTPDCADYTWTTNCVTVTVGIPLYGLYVQNNYLYNSAGSYIYVDGDTYGDVTIDGELKNFGTIKLESDWTNNNTYTADPASLVEFIGSAKQNVTSGGDDFAKVNIENTVTPSATDGVVLKDDMTISVSLTLNDGIIITHSNIVIISDDAVGNVTSPDYLLSWIYGHMSRAIDATACSGTYDFPVGTTINPNLAQFIASSLDGVSNLECYFSITPITPNLNFAAGLLEAGKIYNEVEEEGVWELTPTGAITNGTYDLKLYFNGFSGLADELFNIISRPSDLNDGTNWELCSGSFVATDVVDGYAYRTGCNTFSEKGIGKAELVLPIELLSFNAKCDNDKVLLNWATSSEINNDYFTLYKSADAKIFESFAVIEGAGNSSNILKYSTIDDEPYSEISYYKLKQTDFDGQYTYSTIISAECISSLTNDVIFNVYPVPVNNNDNLFVKLHGIAPQKEVLIVFMDVLGKQYYSKVVLSDMHGTVLEAMDMHNKLPPGAYIVTATFNNIVYKKLVIVKSI